MKIYSKIIKKWEITNENEGNEYENFICKSISYDFYFLRDYKFEDSNEYFVVIFSYLVLRVHRQFNIEKLLSYLIAGETKRTGKRKKKNSQKQREINNDEHCLRRSQMSRGKMGLKQNQHSFPLNFQYFEISFINFYHW